jgi:hypothetical protein
MSTIKVDTIKNKGTSAINLPNNFKIGGLNILQGYTSSGSDGHTLIIIVMIGCVV